MKRALFTLQHTWDSDRGIERQGLTPLEGDDRIEILKRIAFASRSPFMRAERVERITRTALDKMQIPRPIRNSFFTKRRQFYGVLVPSSEGWEFVHRTIQDYLAAQHWVYSGGFASRVRYEWDTRTAYAACISGDATRVLEGALASQEGLTCAIEILSNAPDFDSGRVLAALSKFYSARNRVTVFEHNQTGMFASLKDDLFGYFGQRFLNYMIEEFAQHPAPTTDALLGTCLAELRARLLRMDFSTFEIVKRRFPNLRFQFRLAERGFVTPEMAKPK